MKKGLALICALLLITAAPYAAHADGTKNAADRLTIHLSENFQNNGNREPEIKMMDDNGKNAETIVIHEGSSFRWSFHAPVSGRYMMTVRYLPITGSLNDVEMGFRVNGSSGEQEMDTAILKRVWKDETAPGRDSKGNQLRPPQMQATVFNSYTMRAKLNNEYNTYSLNQGENTVEILGIHESAALSLLIFTPVESIRDYREYQQQYREINAAGKAVRLEAESASFKSDATLYATAVPSTPEVFPHHPYLTVLNAIGGNNWRYDQQWIEWDLNVEREGLYTISLHVKQSAVAGQSSFRKVYIDGVVPFSELNSIAIPYSSKWQTITLGGVQNAYAVYLEKGPHTIRMENTIGDIDRIIRDTQSLVMDLNGLYRKILVYIGNTPDTERDYQLDSLIPELKDTMLGLIQKVKRQKDGLLEITGNKGQDYALFEDLQRQLESFVKSRDKIPLQFGPFLNNIRALSEWLLKIQEQPLTVDYIRFDPAGHPSQPEKTTVFSHIWFGIRSFFASFYADYNTINTDGGTRTDLTVWITGGVASGRDQAQALRNIITNSFTRSQNIGVHLKLVDAGSLIPAVATGNGPDITLYMASRSVMDYGFRGALYELSRFDDYTKSLSGFFADSLTPFTYGGRSYAMPDSYSFSLMFYRRDILEDLGLKIPGTWQEVYAQLPELGNNYLTFGIPSLSSESTEIYTTLLYQSGGRLYDETGTKTELATTRGISAFEMWADFYTRYGLPQTMDLLTYFRTGQAPLVIAPYSFYNNLAAGAPEIDGLWGAAPVPGTLREDGSVNHTVTGTSTGSVIFANTSHPDEAWAFLKWWTGDDTQYRYGIEIESILGPAGRVTPAAQNALSQLPWSKDAKSLILEQAKQVRGLPEVPGGYMTSRYIPTAMRLVVNNNLYPRDAIIDYSALIDQEIRLKRKEFRMD